MPTVVQTRGRSSCSPGSSGHWEACESSTAGHTDCVADISVRSAEALGRARKADLRSTRQPGTLAGEQLDADVVAALQGLYAAGRLDDLWRHGA